MQVSRDSVVAGFAVHHPLRAPFLFSDREHDLMAQVDEDP